MIDHILGRPNPSWKRAQVFLVIIFWFWRILRGNPNGPRLLWIRRANRALQRFTPWQLVVSTLTGVYAVRNLDRILGLAAPEPLAGLYSPSYYRATWINTGLDAGFATAMPMRPKWLRDICSVLFALYYIVYANKAEEKLRKFRAVPTVEMLRTTWEKTTNPYIRALTYFPKVTIRRKVLLRRPNDSTYSRPITAWLFFAASEHYLVRASDLILDFPGGGFISMTPEHHEDRLRMWAVRTGKPVLSIDYGKAPEYPYPYAIDECFDVYRVLVESGGRAIGMSGHKFNVIISGDSAGAHIAVCVMLKILETQLHVPHPKALVLTYPTLDFNFTSWMTSANLRVLQSEQSSGHTPDLVAQKDHLDHISPLAMVGDHKPIRRRGSWRDVLRTLAVPPAERKPPLTSRHSTPVVRTLKGAHRSQSGESAPGLDDAGAMADVEDDVDYSETREEEKPLRARVRFHPHVDQVVLEPQGEYSVSEESAPGPTQQAPLGTRLTMTSRTGYFQDRVISPSMMRAMAILYIGPHRNPEFSTDYHLSPILASRELLAQFPPLLMTCGEKDPFVDDTVIFAGRVREAKRARKQELEQALEGKGPRAKSVEPFKMGAKGLSPEEAVRALRREHDVLVVQREEDWVTMQIFSEWSHGYLQMPMLMQEARTVINDIADWIDSVFTHHDMGIAGRREYVGVASGFISSAKRASPSRRGSKVSPPAKLTRDDSTTTTDTELETETDDLLTFLPKKRVSPPVSSDDVAGRVRISNGSDHGVNGKTKHQRSQSLFGKPDLGEDVGEKSGLERPRFDLLHDVFTQTGPELVANGSNGTSARKSTPPGKSGTPTMSGQTISESELMRRRRLLDSHLIPTEPVITK